MNWTPETLIPWLTAFGLRILGAAAILIVGRIAAGFLRRLVRRLVDRAGVDRSLAGFLGNLTYILVLVFALVAAVGKFGVETASFVAVLGAAGFSVGFALQGSLSNFASGVMLLIFRPFRVGDFIDAAGVAGTVKEIRLFNIVLATGDNVRVLVPNSKVYGDVIRNYSANDTRRVEVPIGIAYDASIDEACRVTRKVIADDERILADPEPLIAVAELGDSSVNLVIRVWVAAKDYWGVRFDLNKHLKESFDAAGIEIPFPQRVVHTVAASKS